MYRKMNNGLRIASATTLVLGLGLPFAAASAEDPYHSLRGEYGFTTVQNCVRTPFLALTAHGFDPATRQLLVNGEVAGAAGSGVMNFARDGTVTVAAGGTEVVESQTAAGQTPVVPGTEYTCTGTYTVGAGDSVSLAFPSCTIKTPNPALTVTVGPLEFEGYIGKNRRSIGLASLKANVQTVAVAAGGNVVQKRERICTQVLTLEQL
jgi:hypothetical protein